MSKQENLTPAYSFTIVEMALLSAAWLSLSKKLGQRGPETELEAAVYVQVAAAAKLSEKLDRIMEAL